MKTKKIAFLFICFLYSFTITAQDLPLPSGKKYTIGDISVTGTTTYNEQTVIAFTGLKKGEEIFIPGDRISSVIKKLWDLDLFSDINLYVTKIEGDTAFLELEIQEVPELEEVKITGIKKKSKREELIKENKLTKGTKVTENLITTTKNYIQDKYRKDGFYNAKVAINTTEVVDSLPTNKVNMVVRIDPGEKVKISDINIVGNEQLSDGRLKRAMKNTKEKNFLRFWKRSKFIPSDYREDKENLLKKYKEKGFRDARIVSDSVVQNGKNLAINIVLEEGDKYYFGDIKFLGNSVYTDRQLKQVLGIRKGDVYNGVLLKNQIANTEKPDANDLTNLYQNSGYLFSDVDAVEVKVYNDTIDFEIRIREGKIAYFDHVTVSGNDRTNDHVIYRELRTRPGEQYSKERIMRTLRELGQLNFFDTEQLIPDITNADPNSGTVNVEYNVVEKGASQIELQGGYGGGGFVGTLGLSFNNFSLSNIFNAEAYQPLPMGDGQRLSLRAQASMYYQTYSFSFTEPWFGGRKPVSLTTSFSHTEQYFYNARSRSADRNRRFLITGVSVGLAKRLTVPDDSFVLSQAIGFQHYDLKNYNTGLFTFGNGYSNNFTYTIGFTRDNTRINPVFPTGGSQFSVSAKLTPPYSLFNNTDYGDLKNQPEYQLRNEEGELIDQTGELLEDGETPVPDQSKIDQEKFKWLEFYKVKFAGTWYTSLMKKLVLRTHTEFGFLGAYNNERGIPPFERFYLGGDGLGTYSLDGREAIQLRGYPNQSLVPLDRATNMSTATDDDGATIYNKFSLELRYPITLKPAASIYALSFLEAGASYDRFQDFNPFLLNRSAGVGLRVFMPQFGLLGIDFGYGFDPIPGTTNPNGWETHFIIGQQF